MALGKSPLVLSLMCGVACHILFNRLEPRRQSIILSLIFGPPAIIAILYHGLHGGIFKALMVPYAIYIGSLLGSTVTYRLSPWHPLAAYPGPVICKITRFWAFYIVQTENQHRYYEALHARYGPYVRTGPNHLHIIDTDALRLVMGPGTPFRRGDRYEVTRLEGTSGSLLSVNDPVEHAQRRRIWDRSMNSSAVQGYRDQLSARISQLVVALEKRQGREVDLSTWLSCFSFDFMGDLVFGGAFRLMEQGADVDGYMHMARLAIRFQEAAGTIPWVKPFQSMIPTMQNLQRFRGFARDSVLARKAMGSIRKDIFYYLLDEEGIGHGAPPVPTLVQEAALAIIAGSDTIGTALSNIFFYLLSNPKILARLQAEIDDTFTPGVEVIASHLTSEMKVLNAVINETLRLQPAVPNGVQRTLPRGCGGVLLSDRWIPEGTTVQIPPYCLHRDSRYFSPEPEGFYPDRWLDASVSKFKHDQKAYFPFSYGPTQCAGKNLALIELRSVVCSLLQVFEFEFALDNEVVEWEKKLGDSYILTKEELWVRVKVRKHDTSQIPSSVPT